LVVYLDIDDLEGPARNGIPEPRELPYFARRNSEQRDLPIGRNANGRAVVLDVVGEG